MWKRLRLLSVAPQPWRMIASRYSSNVSHAVKNSVNNSSANVSSAVNAILLRSLKEHFHEISKMIPPPKVNPPLPFTVVKGALDNEGPVLFRTYNKEEINISATRMANMDPNYDGDNNDDGINQLFLYVHITKPTETLALQFVCALYPEALGIHSVSMQPKAESANFLYIPNAYAGRAFENMDQRTRDAFHGFIQARGINESLFPFLQAFVYVKDHKKLLCWFKSVGILVTDPKQATTNA